MHHSIQKKILNWSGKSLWHGSTSRGRFQILASVALLFAAKVCGVSFFLSIKNFSDNSSALGSIDQQVIFHFGLMLASYKLAEVICNSLRESLLVAPMLNSIRAQLSAAHESAIMWPVERHLREDGKLLPITLVRGARELYMYYHITLLQLLPLIIDALVASALIAFVLSWREGILIMFSMIVYAYAAKRLIEWRMPMRRRMEKADINREVLLRDTYANIQVVKSFGRQMNELDLFKNVSNAYTTFGSQSQHSLGVMLVVQTLIFCATLVTIFSVSYFFDGSKLTAGSVIVAATMLYQLFIPLSGLGSMYRELRNSEMALNPLMELASENLPRHLNAPFDQPPCSSIGVRADGLSVVNENKCIIRDASFNILPGERVAVVGPSGAGKTTLLKCLAGLNAHSSGSLYLDESIVHPSIDGRFPNVFYLPQEATIFSRTLIDNLMLGRDVSENEIRPFLSKLGLDEVLTRCNPDSIEFGHSFSQASGGERQRLAVARGLAQSVGIAIYDEPTSSLDQKVEKDVFDLILSHSKATVVVGTHSSNYFEDFDKIIFIVDGSVIGFDSHQNLLKSCDAYSKFTKGFGFQDTSNLANSQMIGQIKSVKNSIPSEESKIYTHSVVARHFHVLPS
jgi:ATP-binding cassette subfamily B protein